MPLFGPKHGAWRGVSARIGQALAADVNIPWRVATIGVAPGIQGAHEAKWLQPPIDARDGNSKFRRHCLLGPEALLYLFGHSRQEMYVFARPAAGPELVHVATVDLDAAGQAFAFAPEDGRRIFAIDRPTATVRVFLLPEIGTLPAGALPFR